MFTDAFRQQLSLGKYTRWASDLDEPQLEAVLWAVGEFACRAEALLACLDRNENEFVPADGFPRARWALGVLARVKAGERLTLGDLLAEVRPVIARQRAQAEEQFENERHRTSGG